MKDYPISTMLPSPHDIRDHVVSYTVGAQLPSFVDLIPEINEVEDQLQTNSCTANAGASALEIAYSRAGSPDDLSRMYLYWYIRQLGGIAGDNGGYPRDIGKALNRYGICDENTWGFDTTHVTKPPSAKADQDARNNLVGSYARIAYSSNKETQIQEIKSAIASGIPVLTTMQIHKGFYNIGRTKWKEHNWDTTGAIVGYHEVIIVGYDDETKRFLAQNSWGPYWADGGFFGIPYDKIGDVVFEFWVLNKIKVPYVPADGQDTEPNPIIEPEESDGRNIWIVIMIAVVCSAIIYFSR